MPAREKRTAYRPPSWIERQSVRIAVVEAEAERMRQKARLFTDAACDHEDAETAATFERLANELTDAAAWMRRQAARRS